MFSKLNIFFPKIHKYVCLKVDIFFNSLMIQATHSKNQLVGSCLYKAIHQSILSLKKLIKISKQDCNS